MTRGKYPLMALVILFISILLQLFTLEAMALEDNNYEIDRITTVTLEENGRIKVVSTIIMNFDWNNLLISDGHPLDYNLTDVSVAVNGRKYSNFEISTLELKPGLELRVIGIKDKFNAPFNVEYTYYIENFKNYSNDMFIFDMYTTYPKSSFEKTYNYNLKIFSNIPKWSAGFSSSDNPIRFDVSGFFFTNFTRKTTYTDTEKVNFLFFKQGINTIVENTIINVHKDDTVTEINDVYYSMDNEINNGTALFVTQFSINDVLKEDLISVNERHLDKYNDIDVFLNETFKNNKEGYCIWHGKQLSNYKKLLIAYNKGEYSHIHHEIDLGSKYIERLQDGFSKRLTYQVPFDVTSPDSRITVEINIPDDYYINPDVSLKRYLVSDLSASDSNRAVWIFEEKKALSNPIVVEYSTYEKKTGDNILLINFVVGLVLFIASIFRGVIKVKFKKLLEKDVVARFCNLFNPWACIIYVVTLLVGIYITSSNMYIMLKYSYAWIYLLVIVGIFAIEYYIHKHTLFEFKSKDDN